MKIRDKNPELQLLIQNLQEKNIPIWKAVAKGLNRVRRKRYKVNLFRIEKYAKPKEILVVPGVVLGSGEIKKPVTIAALKFSASAKQKIKNAGGKCLSIKELVKTHPNGSKIRIMG